MGQQHVRLVIGAGGRVESVGDAERIADAYAPTATFRWARSSPSAPPVLQQKWIIPGSGFEEWREVETVTLGEDEALEECGACGVVGPSACPHDDCPLLAPRSRC